jgi:hypothetical protein
MNTLNEKTVVEVDRAELAQVEGGMGGDDGVCGTVNPATKIAEFINRALIAGHPPIPGTTYPGPRPV